MSLRKIVNTIKDMFTKEKESGKLRGWYTATAYDKNGNELWSISEKNIVPNEGLYYALGTIVGKTASTTQFYIGLFSGNYTPVSTDTAATFPANATEFTGYNETTRQLWDLSGTTSITSTTISNTGSEAVFTMNQTVTLTGAMLMSASGKGAVTGFMLSAIKWSAAKGPLNSGDQLKVNYGLTVISS